MASGIQTAPAGHAAWTYVVAELAESYLRELPLEVAPWPARIAAKAIDVALERRQRAFELLSKTRVVRL